MLRALRSVAGNAVRSAQRELTLPAAAKFARARDQRGLGEDPGIDTVVRHTMAWLALTQDRSTSQDGGSARHYSLIGGWSASYPETTGYIVPTMLRYAQLTGDATYRERARRMLDWLVSIQMPSGAFQGGVIGETPVAPVTFNTGQILMGLSAGSKEFGAPYDRAMHAAAAWLSDTQDPDGAWRKFLSPFTAVGDKVYDTHVAWGLLEAARVANEPRYAEAALKNIRWALTHQQANGWLAWCNLENPLTPLTHTLGYALRGIIEGYRYFQDPELLDAAQLTADGLMSTMGPDGHIPGQLDAQWRPAAPWVCLTGSVQIAASWFDLYRMTGDTRYANAGRLANSFVRRAVRLDGPPEQRGAVAGSFPVSGAYGNFQYLNWAAKFFVDSQLLEREIAQPATV